MSMIMRNLRYALRQLVKSPIFALTAVLTLALGIGANTAIFTVVYATLLAPMPYPEPDQLVIVWSKIQGDRNGIAAQDYVDWRNQSKSFQALNAWTGGSFNLATKDQPEYVEGQFTTPGMYKMMGVKFQYGRDFLPEEGVAGKERVVVLINKLWRRLGSDPNIVGKQLKIDGTPYTVVGVLAPGMPDRLNQWLIVPLVFKPEQLNHDFHWLLAMGRLKPGVTIKQAQADMDNVTANIAQAFPKSNKGWGAIVEPLKNDFLPKERIQTCGCCWGLSALCLLIACVNVANLLLAKGTTRQKEIAIRIVSRRDAKGYLHPVPDRKSAAGPDRRHRGGRSRRAESALADGNHAPGHAALRSSDLSLNLPILLFTFAASTLAGLLFGCCSGLVCHPGRSGRCIEGRRPSGTGAGRHRLRRGAGHW